MGHAATTGGGMLNFHPMIDLVLVSCGTETEVDATSKGICADGAHMVDFEKDLMVAKPDWTMPEEASDCRSKATDSMVPISRCENGSGTTAPDTDMLGNSGKASVGE